MYVYMRVIYIYIYDLHICMYMHTHVCIPVPDFMLLSCPSHFGLYGKEWALTKSTPDTATTETTCVLAVKAGSLWRERGEVRVAMLLTNMEGFRQPALRGY